MEITENNKLIAEFLGWYPPASKLKKIQGFWLNNQCENEKPDFLHNCGQSLRGFTRFRNWVFESKEMGELIIHKFEINLYEFHVIISDGAKIYKFHKQIEFELQGIFYECLLSFAEQFKKHGKTMDI